MLGLSEDIQKFDGLSSFCLSIKLPFGGKFVIFAEIPYIEVPSKHKGNPYCTSSEVHVFGFPSPFMGN